MKWKVKQNFYRHPDLQKYRDYRLNNNIKAKTLKLYYNGINMEPKTISGFVDQGQWKGLLLLPAYINCIDTVNPF